MLVVLGENDIKTVEDFAGCATDDLMGWWETANGERKHFDGILQEFDIDAAQANEMIMAARLKAGWVTEEELAEEEQDAEESEDTTGDAGETAE